MAMTPPDSLSVTAVCLQITHPPNAISVENCSCLVSCIQECRNGLDLQHRTLEITLNQIITSSSQRLLFTFCLCNARPPPKKKGFQNLMISSFPTESKTTGICKTRMLLFLWCNTALDPCLPFQPSRSAMVLLGISVLKWDKNIGSSYVISKAGINNLFHHHHSWKAITRYDCYSMQSTG